MELALDQRLWEDLYSLEGFQVIMSEVRQFEKEINDQTLRSITGTKQGAPDSGLRFLADLATRPDGDSEMLDAGNPPRLEAKQDSLFGPSTTRQISREFSAKRTKLDEDEVMSDRLASPKLIPGPSPDIHEFLGQTDLTILEPSRLSHLSSLTVIDRDNKKKRLNWQYLYSQRRRLEANWEAAKYTNFQLPHPSHPEEAHEECVYTIQYSGKYLVSGSRDKSLRIWNLDTGRLVRAPLRAHLGSVLCLQFDADPEEDLIVSGSSDATVVLWRFSTGQILQRLRKAHRESVLNVRFDKRILVTCSKDKTIKIFNRNPWNPTDLNKQVPTHLENYGFNTGPSIELAIKPPYSLIAVLAGHSAAVNAVQILGDEIVSASGDRTVKLWNWPANTCERTFLGHHKGIACVQYDGRRIVSGSSDNEVKVFDKETGLEVASLRSHGNLVRTVQAGFGDNPYSKEKDKEDARKVDEEYFRALENGAVSPSSTPSRSRARNAGSWKPENITAYGAQIPPGGGGGRFGRIISGSYDETIIIWRRNKEGAWGAQHTLRQEEGARSAAINPHQPTTSGPSQILNPAEVSSPGSNFVTPILGPGVARDDPEFGNLMSQLIVTAVAQGPIVLQQAISDYSEILYMPQLQSTIDALPPALRGPLNTVMNVGRIAAQPTEMPFAPTVPLAAAELAAAAPPQTQTTQPLPEETQPDATSAPEQEPSTDGPTVPPPAASNSQADPTPAAPPVPTTVAVPATLAQPVPAHHPHMSQNNPPRENMNRVFKLQFDARRIICCSQTPIIVGWDFANNDKQIVEVCRFFAPVE